jgi:hypothetical protein
MNPDNKIILTDVDGVLLNWLSPFYAWMRELGFKQVSTSSYHLNDNFGISREEAFRYVNEYCHSQYMGSLDPFYDASIYVPKIAALGYRFVAITSITDDPSIAKLRAHNLVNHFGNIFDDVICLPLGDSKVGVLDSYRGTNLIWVEDKLENAIAGGRRGLNAMLIDRPYNWQPDFKNNNHYTRIDGWETIYKFIYMVHHNDNED